ncbi:MAG: hypothetical protein ABIT20_01315 [Gemmatimonadaceae bacterium]
MKSQILFVAGLSMFAAAAANAQGGSIQCGGASVNERAAQDACQQAYDVYQFMSPQLGLALAGGNATLGQGSTLGGPGHFSIGVRVNGFNGSLPQVDKFQQSYTGAVSRSLPTSDQWLGLPTADAAIGLFGGVPLPLTNVGGIDALVSGSYVPSFSNSSVSVTPSSNFQLGYGVRVGLLSESIVVPGVSFTYLKRDLPTTAILGVANAGSSTSGTLKIDNMKVKTTAWRVVASKSFLLFSLAGGVGKDSYDQSADISATVSNVPVIGTATAAVPNAQQKLDRTNFFLDASLNLPLFKIVGEVGQASGGTVNTFNSFSNGRADKAQQYFSLGVRFGI